MSRLKAYELNRFYTDEEWRVRFATLFAFREYLSHALVTPGFTPPDSVGNAIALTEQGVEILAKLEKVVPTLPTSARRLAIFIRFGSEDLLIDVAETDAAPIRQMLDDGIVGEVFRYPWRFGNELEKRFRAEGREWVEALPFDEASSLLKACGMGVAQLGTHLAGPFGLLESSEQRIVRPSRYGPTFACSDPACAGLHPIELETGPNPTLSAWLALQGMYASRGVAESNWDAWFYNYLIDRFSHVDDFNVNDLPVLLGDGLSVEELATLTAAVVSAKGTELRDRFPSRRRFASRLGGSAEALSSRLSAPELLQVVLLAEDHVIIEQLDRLIDTRAIEIPSTEIRHPVLRRGQVFGGQYRIVAEASALGVRFDSSTREIGVPRLRRLVRHLYSSPEQLADLEWKLVTSEGKASMRRSRVFVVSGSQPR